MLQPTTATYTAIDSPLNKRLLLIDSLRGYALMGLFLVHMVEYFELYWLKMQESTVTTFTFNAFGGKAYALFALLFGFSFQLLHKSSQENGSNFIELMSRRFIVLLGMGLLHSIFYSGDILQILALAGFILLLLHRLPILWLLSLSAICCLQIPNIIYMTLYISQHPNGMEQPLHWSLYGEIYKTYAEGSFTEFIKINISKANIAKWTFMLESGRLLTILGMAILGYCFSKINFFTGQPNTLKRYATYAVVSLLFAVAFYFINPSLQTNLYANKHWMIGALLNNYKDLFYVFLSLFIFSFLYQLPLLNKALSVFAPCGRMSLTLYVCQSFLFIPFFYGFGLGAYDWIGQNNSFLLGITFWIVQILFARFWFTHFRYGPFEWLWRSVTNKKRIPIKLIS